MQAVNEDDRTLLISMYIDGELNAQMREAVLSKIKSDPLWREEYNALTESEDSIDKAVSANWHDDRLTQAIMSQIAQAPRPSRMISPELQALSRKAQQAAFAEVLGEPRTLRVASNRWKWLWAAGSAAAILLVTFLTLYSSTQSTQDSHKPEPLASFFAELGEIALSDQHKNQPTGTLVKDQTLIVTGELARISWNDGSVLWLRRGTQLTALSTRSFSLQHGQLLLEVARSPDHPFTVALPDGGYAEALGTQFELETQHGITSVKVVEGRVRRALKNSNQNFDLTGGQMLDSNLNQTTFDPRTLALSWARASEVQRLGARDHRSQTPAVIAPWSQFGGAADHSGLTPLAGPRVLSPGKFFPFPTGSNGNRMSSLYAPVIIAADLHAYYLKPDSNEIHLLRADLQAEHATFEATGISLSGQTQYPPVITPKGLIVAGSSSGQLSAWHPVTRQLAWAFETKSSIYGLTAAPNGSIYASTASGVVALDETGNWLWEETSLQDLQTPVAVNATGNLFVVSQSGQCAWLDASGKVLQRTETWPQASILMPPVVSELSAFITNQSGAWGKVTGGSFEALTSGSGQGLSTVPVLHPSGETVYASTNTLHLGEKHFSLHLKAPIQALACDKSGAIFAAIGGTVFRLDPKHNDTRPDFSEVHSGEILRGGIAILHERLLITTTTGIQLFE